MPIASVCLPPPAHYEVPRFTVPAWSCDSHCHVTPHDYENTVPDASYRPAPATPAALRQLRAAIGFGRSVVIQASVYGLDNRAVEQALRGEPDVLRGVVVADRRVSDAQIDQWHALGVRGMRFIMSGQLGGTVGLEDLVQLASRLSERGWHAEVALRSEQWTELMPVLRSLGCPLVIDHLGGLPPEMAGEAEQAIFSLLSAGRAWIKLISYRLCPDLMEPRLIHRAQRLYAAAPERMVWGTDWPHVGLTEGSDAGRLLNAFAGWFDHDAGALNQMLSLNPEVLFDFPRRANLTSD
jgi:predicted TIM-barrel fold metal-dependent hydrolase